MGGHLDVITIIGIAIGLSMDALAVSVANGFSIKELKIRHAVRIAFFFGFFQAIMPLVGWTAGITIRSYIQEYDHWIAFGLLLLIGMKMIWESRSFNTNDDRKNCLHFPTLLVLSIATSIDALAVGISFAMLELKILVPVIIIGAITFVNCFIGAQIGNRVGNLIENKLEIIGGVVLIVIGTKILIEHLVFKI
jgi:putative Mn2+ efflux pump MntP